MFKRKTKTIPLPEKPPKKITISEDTFINMVIEYESGKISGEDMLILFSYIVIHEKYERYLYPHLIELMNYGVITDEGLIDPYKLKEYKNSKT